MKYDSGCQFKNVKPSNKSFSLISSIKMSPFFFKRVLRNDELVELEKKI